MKMTRDEFMELEELYKALKFKITESDKVWMQNEIDACWSYDISFSGGINKYTFEIIEDSELRCEIMINHTQGRTPVRFRKPRMVNLTPHPLKVYADDRRTIIMEFPKPSTANIPRIQEKEKFAIELNGVPVIEKSYSETENLPERKTNVFLIVSLMVLQANPGRDDLLCPDTGNGAVRDESGRIVGTTRFQTLGKVW
jgi:hypothetical protein